MQLDDVAIPVENLLGEVGKGHKVAMCTLNLGRMKMSANCAGTAKKILATTTQYATERRQPRIAAGARAQPQAGVSVRPGRSVDRVAAWLPTPVGLIETRTFIARDLVARKGVLP